MEEIKKMNKLILRNKLIEHIIQYIDEHNLYFMCGSEAMAEFLSNEVIECTKNDDCTYNDIINLVNETLNKYGE